MFSVGCCRRWADEGQLEENTPGYSGKRKSRKGCRNWGEARNRESGREKVARLIKEFCLGQINGLSGSVKSGLALGHRSLQFCHRLSMDMWKWKKHVTLFQIGGEGFWTGGEKP